MGTFIELAKKQEAESCGRILNDGRKFQQEQGFVQWTEDYPNIDTVYKDIEEEKGYVIKIDGTIAGYVCIDFSGEPAYAEIEGKWSVEKDYAAVHRMAFGREFIGIGLADIAFKLIERVCLDRKVPYLRVDTDLFNRRMQHIFEKNGFVKCGVIIFQGSEKVAYDKLL